MTTSYETLNLPDLELTHYPPSSTVSPVLIITLNRPQRHNAYTNAMGQSLETVYDLVDRDERIKAVVLTGKGKTFCAGADLEIGFDRANIMKEEEYRDTLVSSYLSRYLYLTRPVEDEWL